MEPRSIIVIMFLKTVMSAKDVLTTLQRHQLLTLFWMFYLIFFLLKHWAAFAFDAAWAMSVSGIQKGLRYTFPGKYFVHGRNNSLELFLQEVWSAVVLITDAFNFAHQITILLNAPWTSLCKEDVMLEASNTLCSLKRWLRPTMMQQRLTDCAVMHVDKNLCDENTLDILL